jgi:hypothetical protein
MSEDAPIGLTVIEKLLGLILIIVGALFALDSVNSLPIGISQFSGLLTAPGIIVFVVGVFLLITKNK